MTSRQAGHPWIVTELGSCLWRRLSELLAGAAPLVEAASDDLERVLSTHGAPDLAAAAQHLRAEVLGHQAALVAELDALLSPTMDAVPARRGQSLDTDDAGSSATEPPLLSRYHAVLAAAVRDLSRAEAALGAAALRGPSADTRDGGPGQGALAAMERARRRTGLLTGLLSQADPLHVAGAGECGCLPLVVHELLGRPAWITVVGGGGVLANGPGGLCEVAAGLAEGSPSIVLRVPRAAAGAGERRDPVQLSVRDRRGRWTAVDIVLADDDVTEIAGVFSGWGRTAVPAGFGLDVAALPERQRRCLAVLCARIRQDLAGPAAARSWQVQPSVGSTPQVWPTPAGRAQAVCQDRAALAEHVGLLAGLAEASPAETEELLAQLAGSWQGSARDLLTVCVHGLALVDRPGGESSAEDRSTAVDRSWSRRVSARVRRPCTAVTGRVLAPA